MNIEAQVISLELAKEMATLGFKQDSLWWWVHPWQRNKFIERKNRWIVTDRPLSRGKYAAYTVAELGAVLPERILVGVQLSTYYLSITKMVYPNCDEWHVKYRNEGIYDTHCVFKECTQADACAQACIWLRKGGIIRT